MARIDNDTTYHQATYGTTVVSLVLLLVAAGLSMWLSIEQTPNFQWLRYLLAFSAVFIVVSLILIIHGWVTVQI